MKKCISLIPLTLLWWWIFGFFIVFFCFQTTGKPSPSVNWYQANRLIDSTYTIGPHGLVRNELNIRNLNRSDFMSILTCRASNNNVTEPISATVILDMNRKWYCTINSITNSLSSHPIISKSSNIISYKKKFLYKFFFQTFHFVIFVQHLFCFCFANTCTYKHTHLKHLLLRFFIGYSSYLS